MKNTDFLNPLNSTQLFSMDKYFDELVHLYQLITFNC